MGEEQTRAAADLELASRFGGIQLGMSRRQVLETLGNPPDSESFGQDQEPVIHLYWAAGQAALAVGIRNDRVFLIDRQQPAENLSDVRHNIRKSWDRIVPGMSEQQVLNMLGAASHSCTSIDHDSVSNVCTWDPKGESIYSIIFANNKVLLTDVQKNYIQAQTFPSAK